MTTSTLFIGDLLSILGARGIEKQLKRIDGVGQVSVNAVSGSTTVTYDTAKTNLPAIQAAIEECGFHCAGEALPKHVCQTHASSGKALAAPVDAAAQHALRHSDRLAVLFLLEWIHLRSGPHGAGRRRHESAAVG